MSLEIRLSRPSEDVPWGFRLIGGSDFNMPLTIVKVQPSSPADTSGLCNGDILVTIRGAPAELITHDAAYDVIKEGGDDLVMEVLRGRYDLVLDEQEPIYEPYDQSDDFARPSDATEVFLPSLSDNFRPIEGPGIEPGKNRAQTESPFLVPTKPYRPFSTEPVEVPPLEKPIILNPAYHDEFDLSEFVDEDFLPKTKFKLPISPFYIPETARDKRSMSRCSKVEDSTYTSRLEDRSSVISSAFEESKIIQSSEVKETSESIKKTSDVKSEAESLIKSEKTDVQSTFEEMKQEKMTKEEIKHMKQARLDIDLERIEQTASSIVDESIERAVSVAKEIKEQYDIELKGITETESKVSKTDQVKEVEAKSLSVEETKLSTVKELEQIKAGTVKTTTEAFEHASEVSSKAVNEKAQDDIVAGTVKKTSEAFEKTSEAFGKTEVKKVIDVVKTKSAKTEVKAQENARKESASESSSRKVTENVFKTQEETSKTSASERAYTIGLQTIPNIRGHIHSSYHYDLLLRTFFLHLTDVMVALSRIILSQPVFDKEGSQKTTAQDTRREQKVQKEEFTTHVVEEKAVRKESESVEVVQNCMAKEEKVANEVQKYIKEEITEEVEKHKHKSGSKMAQLVEKKSEELTEKMDAVITEFQTKAGIEETEIVLETVPILTETEETRMSKFEAGTSENTQMSETVSAKATEHLTTESRTEARERRSKSREGRQMYVATVESHVYTNKDEILDEQFSESSSLQSVEGSIIEQVVDVATKQIEETKIEEKVLKQETKVEKIEEVKFQQQVVEELVVQQQEKVQEIVEAKLEQHIVEDTKVESIKQISEVTETIKAEEKKIEAIIDSESTAKTVQIYKEIEPEEEIQATKVELFSKSTTERAQMVSENKFESQSVEVKKESFQSEFKAESVEQIEQESSFVAISTADRSQLRRLSLKNETEQVSKSSSNASISSFPSTIDTPTPCTVPPTPLTDEYVFRLTCEVKNLAEPEPKEPSPPKIDDDDEDPHIVKKKLVPHIDTTIERVVYDQPKSPEYTKPGLRGGGDSMTKEEILEIGRKSSLLASAIDQTIRSIEEYKEQAGIPSNPADQPSNEELKMYNGYVAQPTTTVYSQNITAEEEKAKMEQDWASVVTQMKVSNGNKKIEAEKEETSVERNVAIEEETRVERNVEIETKATESSRYETKTLEAESVDTRITEEVKSFEKSETEKALELEKVVAGLITKSEEIKREPLEGYRPVPFDPEEIRHQMMETMEMERGACEVKESTQTVQRVERELIGGSMGIVDGLEDTVMDPEIAKELGKPGITEDKIAEIMSGESEMLREAHVMGLQRVIASHMLRPDDTSSVDFNKIKPTMDRLKDSEVIKALNEELTKTKTEKKEDERKWTKFLQKPSRPVPSAKFGYPGYMMEPQEVYKPKIVKQPKPKVAPDYKPEDFDTGLLPWEERANTEPPPPSVQPEDPILIPEPENEVQFFEAVDPLPESAVPDLEETDITLPESESDLETQQPELSGEPEVKELDLEQVVEETEQVVSEDMDKSQLADQLVMNVQSMVDPNATIEQQLAHMRSQLAALAQLPGVIQQTLELVTKQLSSITQQEISHVEARETVESTETVEEKITKTIEEIIEESSENSMAKETIHEESTVVTGVTEERKEVEEKNKQEIEALRREEAIMVAEQAVIEKQKKEMIDQMQLEHESRQVKQHPTPRVGKPKPMFGPLTPQERPQVLPGGRKWRNPKDAYNDALFTETMQAQAEIIQGKAKGLFESHILPYDERINFMKYEKPPVTLDHLRESDVYKLVHNMDATPVRRVDMLTPVVAECDYREKCRSMTPCTERIAQIQP